MQWKTVIGTGDQKLSVIQVCRAFLSPSNSRGIVKLAGIKAIIRDIDTKEVDHEIGIGSWETVDHEIGTGDWKLSVHLKYSPTHKDYCNCLIQLLSEVI
jgi:hypothetical protein